MPAAVCDPVTQDLIINEILADPGTTDGDANNDGTINTSQDEFVELYNIGNQPLDISGYTMEDGYTTRHTFPAQTTIGSGEFFVLFGGGSVDNFNGNSQVSSSGSLGLNNGGDDVIIKNTAGVVVVTVTYSGATDQSICRDPDFTGEFVGHLSHSTNARVFSPGLTNDTPLSINNYENNLFVMYPNPSNTGFVNIKSNQIGAVQAQVFDMLGKQMIDTTVVNERLEVSSLNAGIYIVKLTQNDRTTTKKLILQ